MIKIQFLKNWSGHKLFIYEFTFFKLFTSHLKLVTGRVTQLIDHFKLVAGHDKKMNLKKNWSQNQLVKGWSWSRGVSQIGLVTVQQNH
jgi:hypothetical protein